MTDFSTWQVGDFLSFGSILVQAGFGFWIVKSVQKKLTNKRILKDHFIGEIKELREDYRVFFIEIFSSQLLPKPVSSWFKMMNMKSINLIDQIRKKHPAIAEYILKPYLTELRSLITDSNEFNSCFKENSMVEFGPDSRADIHKFQAKYDPVFNEIIVMINDE